jgi:hypothetical protein
MIEIDLYNALNSICERTYPLIFPDNVIFPAMSYQVIFDGANQATNGNYMSRDVRFQVDIYSKSYAEAKDLKGQVVASIIFLGAGDISAQDLYDDETELYRQLIDFNIKRS